MLLDESGSLHSGQSVEYFKWFAKQAAPYACSFGHRTASRITSRQI